MNTDDLVSYGHFGSIYLQSFNEKQMQYNNIMSKRVRGFCGTILMNLRKISISSSVIPLFYITFLCLLYEFISWKSIDLQLENPGIWHLCLTRWPAQMTYYKWSSLFCCALKNNGEAYWTPDYTKSIRGPFSRGPNIWNI